MKKLLAVLLLFANAEAATLDWSDYTWGGTTLTNNFGGVGISLSGATDYVTSLTIDASNSGGVLPPKRGFRVAQDLSSTAQLLLIDIDFRTWGGANDVAFSIYNVDRHEGFYTDEVLVIGLRNGLEVLPLLQGSEKNTTVGALTYGTGYVHPYSEAGNINVSFFEPIDRVMIRYRNLYDSPRVQDITIGNMSYNIPSIPEPSTWFALLLLTTLIIRYEHRSLQMSKSS